MNDLLNLFQPGLLSDLTGMLRQSILKIPSWKFSTATVAEVRWPGQTFVGIRNQMMNPVIINPAGPNAPMINSTLAKYTAIPPFLGGFVQVSPPIPMPLTGPVELAKDNPLYGPIMAYLDSGFTDITNVLFNIIQDNIDTKSTTIPISIRNVLATYCMCIDNTINCVKLAGSLYDPNIPEIAERLAGVLTPIFGTTVWPPTRMPYGDLYFLCSTLPAVTGVTPAPRLTPGNYIVESAMSVVIGINRILNAGLKDPKTFYEYNTSKNIALLKTIPSLIESIYPLINDPPFITLIQMTNMPIPQLSLPTSFPETFPEPLKTLIASLNTTNFIETVPTSIIASPVPTPTYIAMIQLIGIYFCMNLPQQITTGIQRLAWLHNTRSLSSMEQVYRSSFYLTKILKILVRVLNMATTIFKIRLIDDTAAVRFINVLNDCTLKSGFSINLVPIAAGGKRKKRSRKPSRRRTRSTRHKKNLKHK